MQYFIDHYKVMSVTNDKKLMVRRVPDDRVFLTTDFAKWTFEHIDKHTKNVSMYSTDLPLNQLNFFQFEMMEKILAAKNFQTSIKNQ